jgi:hypothetical protein
MGIMRKILNYILRTFVWENGYLGKEYELEYILTYADKGQAIERTKIYEHQLNNDYYIYMTNLLYNEIKEEGLIKVSTCIYGMNEQEYQKQKNKKFVKGLDKENGKLWYNNHLNIYA